MQQVVQHHRIELMIGQGFSALNVINMRVCMVSYVIIIITTRMIVIIIVVFNMNILPGCMGVL